MIYGHINDLEKCFAWLPAPFKTALEHLKKTDLLSLSAGSYELQGRDIYFQVIDTTTKPLTENRPEIHREYIDVQYLCKGAEKMGFAVEDGTNTVAEDLLKERDLLFYTGVKNESTLLMLPGNFAVFFPNDVHRPACAVDQPMPIRKVVVKIRASLL